MAWSGETATDRHHPMCQRCIHRRFHRLRFQATQLGFRQWRTTVHRQRRFSGSLRFAVIGCLVPSGIISMSALSWEPSRAAARGPTGLVCHIPPAASTLTARDRKRVESVQKSGLGKQDIPEQDIYFRSSVPSCGPVSILPIAPYLPLSWWGAVTVLSGILTWGLHAHYTSEILVLTRSLYG